MYIANVNSSHLETIKLILFHKDTSNVVFISQEKNFAEKKLV